MALHLSPAYREGLLAWVENFLDLAGRQGNPYGFFDAYAQHYAWDIGFQAARSRIRERSLSPGEVRRAWDEGEDALFRLLRIKGGEI